MGRKVGKLTDEQRLYVVQRLACFDSLSSVMEGVKSEFGVDISMQGIECYDPNKAAGRGLSKKWKTIFEETRAAFLADVSQIPIANRAVRLRTLQRMADTSERQKNMVLTASLLEQAAKEVGEAYTNKRQISGEGGGPITFKTVYEGRDGD